MSYYDHKSAVSVEHYLEQLNEFIALEGVTEIAINREKEVWCEIGSVWKHFHAPNLTYGVLDAFAVAVASYCDNTVSKLDPILSATLPKGERIQIGMPPACQEGTISITIRKPNTNTISMSDFSSSGFFDHISSMTHVKDDCCKEDEHLNALLQTRNFETFLIAAVKAGKNIVVSGATGTGKTTFMKMLIDHIPDTQRIITIEDVAEISLPKHQNKVHLYYPSDGSADSTVTSAKLLKSCLRMKPDRILLAELRGSETFDWINVAGSGHSGTITSCHASNVALTFERLALMCMYHPQAQSLPYEVIKRLLHQTVDIVIQIKNDVYSDVPLGRHIKNIYFNS